jgi:hypothetical protein
MKGRKRNKGVDQDAQFLEDYEPEPPASGGAPIPKEGEDMAKRPVGRPVSYHLGDRDLENYPETKSSEEKEERKVEKSKGKGFQGFTFKLITLKVLETGTRRTPEEINAKYEKMLEDGKRCLELVFDNNPHLSGVPAKRGGTKEQKANYRKTIPEHYDMVMKSQCWNAVQMASQEKYLESIGYDDQKYEMILIQALSTFATHKNDDMKVQMLDRYIERAEKENAKGKGRDVSPNFVKQLDAEFKIRREYECPEEEGEEVKAPKKKMTPADLISAVTRLDLSAIAGMTDEAFTLLVMGLTADQCLQLKDGVEKLSDWVNKGLTGKLDYLEYRISKIPS